MLSSNPCLITSGTSRIAKPKLAYRLSRVTSVASNCLHSLRDLKLLRYEIIKSVKLLQRFTTEAENPLLQVNNAVLPLRYLYLDPTSSVRQVPKKSLVKMNASFFYFANMIKEKQLSITAHCMKKLSNLNS